jgi:predicted membrane-bound spermidine synthase
LRRLYELCQGLRISVDLEVDELVHSREEPRVVTILADVLGSVQARHAIGVERELRASFLRSVNTAPSLRDFTPALARSLLAAGLPSVCVSALLATLLAHRLLVLAHPLGLLLHAIAGAGLGVLAALVALAVFATPLATTIVVAPLSAVIASLVMPLPLRVPVVRERGARQRKGQP